MPNPRSTASTSPRLSVILPLTLIGTLLFIAGLWFGWEAAMEVKPVHFSFECEPSPPV